MIILKTKEEMMKMKQAGEILASCHRALRTFIKPGITTEEIDQYVEKLIEDSGAIAEQKGSRGHTYATCNSVNDVICHGFPSKTKLVEGDIITVDMVVNLDGWLADSAWSYAVGEVSDQSRKLLDVTKEALYKGIEQAVAGNRIGDI